LLFGEGFRYRLHARALPGTPDIVLPKYRVVVFVHGCFWHGHDCHLFKLPSTRRDFWQTKIDLNRQRDSRDITALLEQGWSVLCIWECAIKGRLRLVPSDIATQLASYIRRAEHPPELKHIKHRPEVPSSATSIDLQK
ncbi:DNA mismatch endonuclease Vsr, partial [Halobellus sp. Atlit-31R]